MKILMDRPPRRPRATPILDETWEKHKDKIRELYLDRKQTLEEVMTEMLTKHNFPSS
jgi:hypothetical protein